MGRKRIPEEEKKITVGINLKQKVVKEIEKEGKPKHIIEKMVNEKYGKD
ncbi:hypothetical protein M5X00_29390 [Paenibacillus alvei]|nr:hypothetical protein [Paenibacillus alvei]MCY7488064.1 hypothetical protein [Paenibacillus alvei]MCY9758334.1 hypothetical protein [Paenibacillus alvei]